MKYLVKTLADTTEVAETFAKTLKKGDVVALYGNLGAGKTAFCRALISFFNHKNKEIPSPTFTLLQTYETPDYPIYHFDFYRLKTPEEAYEIGIEDAFYNGVSLIEWPERLGKLLPLHHKTVQINILQNNQREIIIE